MKAANPLPGNPGKLPVLLIHGLTASRHDWAYLDPALKAAGYCTYSIDLLGHGSGSRPSSTSDYQYQCLRDDFVNWVDRLKLDQPPVLMGHSLGGYLALDYALHAGNPVSGLVLIAPFYSQKQLPAFMRLLYKIPFLGAAGMRLAPQWLIQLGIENDRVDGQSLTPKAQRQMALDTKRASPQVFYFPRSLPDLTPELPKIKLSSLVIWGEIDHTLHPHSYPDLVKALPSAQGHRVGAIGHQPHLGKSEIVNSLVLKFLEELDHHTIKPAALRNPAEVET
jgi:pimeloyl-ACP methyl ester carboxylesterase